MDDQRGGWVVPSPGPGVILPGRWAGLPWIDEREKRRPGWTAGRLFVGGDGQAWAMPVIDETTIAYTPELSRYLEAAEAGDVTCGGWLGPHDLADRAAAALIGQQYDLTPGELLRVLASQSGVPTGASPESIAMHLGHLDMIVGDDDWGEEYH